MKYTKQDLELNKQAYRENFAKLLSAFEHSDTESHDLYAKREKELHKEQERMMKELGVFTHNHCPTLSSIVCVQCTGYFKKTYRERRVNTLCKYKFEECPETDPEAVKCDLKNVRAL